MQNEDLSTKARRASKEVLISSVKSVFGMTPVIGTALAEIFFEYGNRIKAARLERFISHLSSQIQLIDESKLGHDYLQSEDFYDVAHAVIDKAIKSKAHVKHYMLAQILLDSVNQSIIIDDSIIDIYINYVDSLKPIQIKMLNYFNNNQVALEEIGSYSRLYDVYTTDNPVINITKDEFKLFCSDLENKALISTGDGLTNFDNQSSFMAYEDHKDASLIVTSVGHGFLNYITGFYQSA